MFCTFCILDVERFCTICTVFLHVYEYSFARFARFCAAGSPSGARGHEPPGKLTLGLCPCQLNPFGATRYRENLQRRKETTKYRIGRNDADWAAGKLSFRTTTMQESGHTRVATWCHNPCRLRARTKTVHNAPFLVFFGDRLRSHAGDFFFVLVDYSSTRKVVYSKYVRMPYMALHYGTPTELPGVTYQSSTQPRVSPTTRPPLRIQHYCYRR